MNEETPDKKALLNYSLIAMPLAFAGLPLYIHMPDFYTREFGIGIGALGMVLLVIRMIDALQDPFIGYVSDKVKGHRPFLVYLGVFCLFVGLAGLSFGPPYKVFATAWFALFMVLATTGFSIVTININMLGGFWKKDHHQRVKISTWREGFGLLGLLIAALLPTVLQSQFSDTTSFVALFFVFCLLMIPAFLFFRRFMKDFHATQSASLHTHQPSFAVFSILTKSEKLFFFICFLSYLAASIPAILVLFFIRDYLGAEAFSGVFLALYFSSGMIFMWIWSKGSKKYGSYKTWAFAMILSVITFMGAGFLSAGDLVAYGLICILSGIVLGADLALPPAIIAGRIHAKGHENQATQYYAVLAFLPKAAMALAAGFSFLVLEEAGFKADDSNSENSLKTLLIVYAIVPCLIKSVSTALLWHLIKKEGYADDRA